MCSSVNVQVNHGHAESARRHGPVLHTETLTSFRTGESPVKSRETPAHTREDGSAGRRTHSLVLCRWVGSCAHPSGCTPMARESRGSCLHPHIHSLSSRQPTGGRLMSSEGRVGQRTPAHGGVFLSPRKGGTSKPEGSTAGRSSSRRAQMPWASTDTRWPEESDA